MKTLLKKLIAAALAVTMVFGSAVTSFAESGNDNTVTEGEGTDAGEGEGTDTGEGEGTDTGEGEGKEDPTPAPAAATNVVWVNGKDVKANESKKIEALNNKTIYIKMDDLKAATAETETKEEKTEATVAETASVEVGKTAEVAVTEAAGTVTVKSADEAIATATITDGKITITGVKAGTVKVTVTDTPAEGEATEKEITVTVTEAAASKTPSLTVDKETVEVINGKTAEVAVTAANGAEGDAVVVKTGNKKIAEVAYANGKLTITAKGAGEATITVTYGELTKEVKVTVKNPDAVEGLNATLPEGAKYIYAVTASDKTALADAFDLEKGKTGENGKVKVAKAKWDKKTESLKIQAGKLTDATKTEESVNVWIAEWSKDLKCITNYKKIAVTAKVAPKKLVVQIPAVEADKEKGVEAQEAIQKKATINVKDTINLEAILPEGVIANADTTYKWEVKAPKNATEDCYKLTVAQDSKSATFQVEKMATATKAEKYTVTCINVNSQKKAKFAVTVTNDFTKIEVADVTMKSAKDAAVTEEIALGDTYSVKTAVDTKFESTDKVKAYTTEKLDTESAKQWSVSEDNKFALTGTKSSALSAKIAKDGKITLKAKKGTADGTQAQVILVATHKDKTVDVYTFAVTIGTASTEEETKAGITLKAADKDVTAVKVTAGASTEVAVAYTGTAVENAVFTTEVTTKIDDADVSKVTATVADGKITIAADAAAAAGEYTVTVSYGVKDAEATATATLTVTVEAAAAAE